MAVPYSYGGTYWGEDLIGGFYSGNLALGMIKGFQIIFTTRRIVGFKKRGKAFLTSAALGALFGAAGAVAGSMWSSDIKPEQKAKILAEINTKKKDLEVWWEEIVAIELKKPTFWHSGHMIIWSNRQGKIKIKVLGSDEFNKLYSLCYRFKPQVLRVIQK